MSSDKMFEQIVRVLATGNRPAAGIQTFRRETVVSTALDETFAFFSDAGNLQRLTPPWIKFAIRSTLPIEMHAGTIIDYQISLYGVPVPWRTRIDVWEPGVRFVDRQVAGPYRWWRHEHLFETCADGTRVIDAVEYVPRASALSSWLVRRDVDRIFTYRQEVLPGLLSELVTKPPFAT
jgi:ligand-binding SRPBCC domain-containing protein